MDILTIANTILCVVNTTICCTLSQNFKLDEDIAITNKKPQEHVSQDIKDDTRQTSNSNTLKETIIRIIIEPKNVPEPQPQSVPAKPQRAFRQLSAKDSTSVENNAYSQMHHECDRLIRCSKPCYHEHCQNQVLHEKEAEVQKVATPPTEKNSSGSLPVSNESQKISSSGIDTDPSKSISENPESKSSKLEIVTSSSQSKNSQNNSSCVNQNIKSNGSSQYLEVPTLSNPLNDFRPMQRIENKAPLTSTEIETKHKIVKKCSPLRKLCKHFPSIFYRCKSKKVKAKCQ